MLHWSAENRPEWGVDSQVLRHFGKGESRIQAERIEIGAPAIRLFYANVMFAVFPVRVRVYNDALGRLESFR